MTSFGEIALLGGSSALLLLASAFFSASETALFSIPREQITAFKFSGDRRDLGIHALLADGQRTLLLLLFCNLFVNILLVGLIHQLVDRALGRPSALVTMVAATSVLLLFGEMLPKNIALRNNIKIAKLTSPLLRFLSVALRPLLDSARAINTFFLRQFGKQLRDPAPFITEEELATAINEYARAGAVNELERRLIVSMLNQGRKAVKMLMIHRGALLSVGPSQSCEQTLAALRESQATYCLVTSPESAHKFAGLVYGLELASSAPDTAVIKVCSPPLWVHDSLEAGDCFSQMLEKGYEQACVIDEFGALCGVVQLADIIDEVLRSAYCPQEANALTSTNVRVCRGGDEIHDLQGWLPQGLFASAEKVRTLNGLITAHLGQIPRSGYKFALDGFDFYIVESSQTVVRTVLIRKPGESLS